MKTKTISKIRKMKQLRGLETNYLNKAIEMITMDAYRMIINRANLTDEDLADDEVVNTAYLRARKLTRLALTRHINRIV